MHDVRMDPSPPAKGMPRVPLLLLVHFGDSLIRGSERCLLNLIKGINSDQYQVVLWCNNQALADLAAPFAARVEVGTYSPPFGFGYAPSAQGAWADLRQLLLRAKGLVREINPKLIICNSIAPCQWMVPVSLLSGIPLLSYHHTTYRPKARLMSLAFGATRMVGVSEFTLANFRCDGFPQLRSAVIYNGVEDLAQHPVDRHKLRQELGIGKDQFLVTSISALLEWKKVDLIIESFRLLSQRDGSTCTLLIVGEGPCRGSLQAQAQGLRVIFVGWRSDVANILAASDCVVVAAELEAFALTIIEAASMKVPVVGVRAGGVKEIIVDGENGLFAEPGSAKSLAAAIQRLRVSPELRQRLGSNARLAFEAKYRVERMVFDLCAQIDELSCRVTPFRNATGRRLFNLLYGNARLIGARLLYAMMGKVKP